jgi:hypothetical protein
MDGSCINAWRQIFLFFSFLNRKIKAHNGWFFKVTLVPTRFICRDEWYDGKIEKRFGSSSQGWRSCLEGAKSPLSLLKSKIRRQFQTLVFLFLSPWTRSGVFYGPNKGTLDPKGSQQVGVPSHRSKWWIMGPKRLAQCSTYFSCALPLWNHPFSLFIPFFHPTWTMLADSATSSFLAMTHPPTRMRSNKG